MRFVQARRQTIRPSFFPQHEIDPDKVKRIVAALGEGRSLPPVVAVQYGDTFMPIDGHHRFSGHLALGRVLEAWTVDGEVFEDLDRDCRDAECGRAEDWIVCGGVPATKVAERFDEESRTTGAGQPVSGAATS